MYLWYYFLIIFKNIYCIPKSPPKIFNFCFNLRGIIVWIDPKMENYTIDSEKVFLWFPLKCLVEHITLSSPTLIFNYIENKGDGG